LDHKSYLLERAEKKWTNFFIHKTKVAFLFLVGIMIAGIGSVILIPKESAPKIDYGIIQIRTVYIGAPAIDIDQLITQEIENEIKSIDGVRKINSVSNDSLSLITLDLETDANINKIQTEIQNSVNELKSILPTDAEDPKISDLNSSNERSLFTVHLTGDLHPVILRDYAEKLKKYLDNFSYIQSVDILGGSEREIFIDINPLLLEQYNVSILDIQNVIRSTHKNSPIGNFQIGDLDYSLRIQGRHVTLEDIKNVVVKQSVSGSNSSILRVEDVAHVYMENEEFETLEFFRHGESSAMTSTVKVMVNRADSTDIFKIDPVIRKNIQAFILKEFDNNIELAFTMEELEDVKESYENVIRSGLSSIIIVIIIIMLFIGIREALLAGSVIPLSFLTTIAITYFNGGALNFMINFSMILALGILVDTSIVIVEAIHEGIAKGFTRKESAIMALEEFKMPLISGMLTTLAVFIPLFTLPGVLGKYLSFIPIAVAITLLSSLFISLLIIPAISSVLLRPKVTELSPYRQWFNRVYKKITGIYSNFLSRNLKSQNWRIAIIWSVFIAFLLSLMIPVQFKMIPGDDFNLFQVQIRMPYGTVEEETKKALNTIEALIYKEVPEMKKIEMTIQNDIADMTVHLYQKDIRAEKDMRKSSDIAQDLRIIFKTFQLYEVFIKEASMGPDVESPVAIRVITDDAENIGIAQKVALDLKNILQNIPGTDNITDDIANVPAEIQYRINHEEALRKGVNPQDIAAALQSAVRGITVISLNRGDREIDIHMRYDPQYMKNFHDIHAIQIKNNMGDSISLSQLVEEKVSSGLQAIRRSDGNIAITIASQLQKGGNALEVTKLFQEKIDNYDLPEGIFIKDVGENSENSDLFVALGFGLFIAIFLIFSILVIQFNSFSQPVIILYTIVMSVLGVNVGLFLTDTPRSLAFIIGIISLSGIVVNDAIIMVDRINNLRNTYPQKSLKEVIVFAAVTRLQPIVLTTLTTAAGIFPLIFVDKFWAGLSITIIFGLVVASSLTLIVTPAMYYQLHREGFITLMPGLFILGLGLSISAIMSVSIPLFFPGVLLCGGSVWYWKKCKEKKAMTGIS
jgi:multidrug efflux pump subunit AcrB